MNNDLISRSALREEVKTLFCLGSYKRMMLDCIDNAQTVHGIVAFVERPKGEWQPDMDSFYCDQCGVTALEINRKWYKSNFCPNCGADMRGNDK